MKENTPDHAIIADRARSLWEKAGSPAGRDEEFWFGAEQELRTEMRSSAPPVIAPPRGTSSLVPTSPVNTVPPPIRPAVTTRSRRPTRSSVR